MNHGQRAADPSPRPGRDPFWGGRFRVFIVPLDEEPARPGARPSWPLWTWKRNGRREEAKTPVPCGSPKRAGGPRAPEATFLRPRPRNLPEGGRTLAGDSIPGNQPQNGIRPGGAGEDDDMHPGSLAPAGAREDAGGPPGVITPGSSPATLRVAPARRHLQVLLWAIIFDRNAEVWLPNRMENAALGKNNDARGPARPRAGEVG